MYFLLHDVCTNAIRIQIIYLSHLWMYILCPTIVLLQRPLLEWTTTFFCNTPHSDCTLWLLFFWTLWIAFWGVVGNFCYGYIRDYFDVPPVFCTPSPMTRTPLWNFAFIIIIFFTKGLHLTGGKLITAIFLNFPQFSAIFPNFSDSDINLRWNSWGSEIDNFQPKKPMFGVSKWSGPHLWLKNLVLLKFF